MDRGTQTIRGVTDAKTWEWITALAAAGFDYELTRDAMGWAIGLPSDTAEAARAEIDAYETDNRDWPPAEPPARAGLRLAEASWSPLWVAGFLAAFYIWLGAYDGAHALLRSSAMEAGAVRGGEWWRTITALTLHADAGHLAGNMCCLLLLGHAACGLFGSGVAWALILAAGVAGNAMEAWFFAGWYVSVGASTAGFGALGLLAANRAVYLALHGGLAWPFVRRSGLPLVAGLAMLALLGSGPNSNTTAHLLGMFCGATAGAVMALLPRLHVPAWMHRVLEMACLTVVMLAWRKAFAAV